MPPEEDDPVIASYDVYISAAPTSPNTDSKTDPSKMFVLQYPSHRPSTRPYTASRSQKPTSFRMKPTTGIFEVDIPILTTDNYNVPLGSQFGRAMHDSQLSHPTTGHGLSGGFSQNQSASSNQHLNLHDLPEHVPHDSSLRTQTLGGKLSESTDRDPVYMLATLNQNSNEIYLRHLDGVIQMRPQLHHIDAADEAKRRAETVGKQKVEVVGLDGKIKLETKAIEMKLKDSNKEDPKDRNLNRNATFLRNIQNEHWQRFDWVEKADVGYSHARFHSAEEAAAAAAAAEAERPPPTLRAVIDNDEWLNRMSSPGIELRTRLKGRDRERARRKRQERLRAAKTDATMNMGTAVAPLEPDTVADGDESEESSASDEDEEVVENLDVQAMLEPSNPDMQIKQEGPDSAIGASTTTAPPKRRGRPPKNRGSDTVNLT